MMSDSSSSSFSSFSCLVSLSPIAPSTHSSLFLAHIINDVLLLLHRSLLTEVISFDFLRLTKSETGKELQRSRIQGKRDILLTVLFFLP